MGLGSVVWLDLTFGLVLRLGLVSRLYLAILSCNCEVTQTRRLL